MQRCRQRWRVRRASVRAPLVEKEEADIGSAEGGVVLEEDDIQLAELPEHLWWHEYQQGAGGSDGNGAGCGGWRERVLGGPRRGSENEQQGG